MRLSGPVVLLSLLAGGSLGCDRSDSPPPESTPQAPAPRWVDLTVGHPLRPIAELAEALERTIQPPRGGRVVPDGTTDGAELCFELPLARESWRPGEDQYEWRMLLPTGGAMQLCERSSFVLERGDKQWRKALRKNLRTSAKTYDERFQLVGNEIVMLLPEGAAPPERLRGRMSSAGEENGHRRATQYSFTCNGFLVFPGEPESIPCVIPPASALCFSTVVPDPDGSGEVAPTTYRVRLDGRVLFEHHQSYRVPVRAESHRVALEVEGAHTLLFEIEGPSPALFAAPLLAPAVIGTPAARPWPEAHADAKPDARPDVVVLLLDTFRADNLAAWGGDPALAPKLNALVERSLRFTGARAVAAWTLPSIGSLMTGLFPGQHGGTDLDRMVVAEADTLAEVLTRAGYRTAAITDSGLFAHQFGQDQGFEWFEEISNASWPAQTGAVSGWNLDHTLAKARQRIAADDGRPLFLVVHTYRVHEPLRVGPDEDPRPWEEESARLEAAGKGQHTPESASAALGFYRQAVADLDQEVGAFVDELESSGFLERGLVVVTADHGNAFGENGEIGHGGTLFDVKLRVPLAIAGRGVAPRAVTDLVSTIDLAPTIAALAGVAPSPSWAGRSLLESGPVRPSWAFDLRRLHTEIALFSGGRKLLARDAASLAAGQPTQAFDLGADPAEEKNLVGGADWPAALGRELGGGLEALITPLSGAKQVELPDEKQQELKDIGYF